MAAFNMMMNVGVLIGPLLASFLVSTTGVVVAVFIAAGVRAIGFLALLKWG